MFTTDETVGLAEWIIDDTCLGIIFVFTLLNEKRNCQLSVIYVLAQYVPQDESVDLLFCP